METQAGTANGHSSPGPSGSAESSRAHSPWGSSAPRAAHAASPTPGRCLQSRSQGMAAMRKASMGGTGDPGGFLHPPCSNSEHEQCVAIGTSLNTVTLVTTATSSHRAHARPCAPPVGVPPELQPAACPVSRSHCHVGPAGTGTDLSSLAALHHPQYHESHWKSPPRPEQGVRLFQSPVDQPGHRHLCPEACTGWTGISSGPTSH